MHTAINGCDHINYYSQLPKAILVHVYFEDVGGIVPQQLASYKSFGSVYILLYINLEIHFQKN